MAGLQQAHQEEKAKGKNGQWAQNPQELAGHQMQVTIMREPLCAVDTHYRQK